MEEDEGWFLDDCGTPPFSCQHPELGHESMKNTDCSPGFHRKWDHCCVDPTEPRQMRCADFIKLRSQISEFERRDALIVIMGRVQRLDHIGPFGSSNVCFYIFLGSKRFDGTSPWVFCCYTSSLTKTCPGFIWDIPLLCWPLMGRTLKLLLLTSNESPCKCYEVWIMSLPRPILKIHVGLISRRVLGNLQTWIVLVGFQFLYLLGKGTRWPKSGRRTSTTSSLP